MPKSTIAISTALLDRIHYLAEMLGGYEAHLINGGKLTAEITYNTDWARSQLADCAIGILEEIKTPSKSTGVLCKGSGKIH
ncbi:hypothetical protein [Microbulbifer variabilis]|uniref:hypothetical protein n=1 Tax=Microbulbifer variabilis TaxID=266805 RepID=UPI001CFD0228|nr:hypothetical protein [Microbulbifer variabilis]